MRLEGILLNRQHDDKFGRAAWFQKDVEWMPTVKKVPNGWERLVRNSETRAIGYEPYVLTDEDRVANDWVIVQIPTENPVSPDLEPQQLVITPKEGSEE